LNKALVEVTEPRFRSPSCYRESELREPNRHVRPTLQTERTVPSNTEVETPSANRERLCGESNDALHDKHLAEEHHLKRVTAYVKEAPTALPDSDRKGSAARMERLRAKKSAQGLVQSYVPADILAIAKNDGDDWEPTRAAIAIGRRVLALHGWRAKILALLLLRS